MLLLNAGSWHAGVQDSPLILVNGAIAGFQPGGRIDEVLGARDSESICRFPAGQNLKAESPGGQAESCFVAKTGLNGANAGSSLP